MDLLVTSHTASSALCFLLGISLFSSRALNPICARVLGVIFLMLSAQHSLAALNFSEQWPLAGLIRPCIAMVIAPAIYTYFLYVLKPERPHPKRLLWHLPPSLIMVGVIALEAWSLITPLITASFGAYGIAMFYQLKKRPSEKAPIRQAGRFARQWLYVLVAVMAINVIVEPIVDWELGLGICLYDCKSLLWASILFLLSYLASLFLVLTRAPLLEWMHELKHLPTPSNKPEPSQQELTTLFEQWQQLVLEKELFMSENTVTIAKAARMLGVPSRQLSQAINTIYGGSFSQYLNDLRVERAKTLLTENHQSAITEVYLEAGFSTKSHFHREFARVTNMTPSEFRQRYS